MSCQNKFFKNHKWSKWEEIEHGTMTRHHENGSESDYGVFAIIKRNCEDCGFVEFDNIRQRI